MARAGSTTSRSTSSRGSRSAAAKAAEQAADSMVEEVTAENDFDSTMVEADSTDENNEINDQVEETEMSETETVETPAEAAVVSDTTEADEAAKKAEADKVAAEKLDTFKAVTAKALDERDVTTGEVPVVHTQDVLKAYRGLPGAKSKSAAKKHLTDLLKSAINSSDIVLGMSIMQVTNLVTAAPASTPKAPVEAKKVDPTDGFVEALAALHLAYTLRRAAVPEGVDAEAAYVKVDEKVNELSDAAESYYAWTVSKDADKGDEPEVDPIVKRAVKASLGKAAGASKARSTSSAPKTPHTGARRNVRTHIAQVFGDAEVGTVMKVAEIAKASTEEYPDGDCSPGAVSAALKSDKGVEGFEKTTDDNGNLAARKIA